MATKRSSTTSTDGDDTASPKRIRLDETPIVNGGSITDDEEITASESSITTQHGQARRAIQRSLAAVLAHDGFDSATPAALESFTGLVEEYLGSMIQEIKALALASRREHPLPSDFAAVLRRFNLPTSSLKPHLQTPIELPKPLEKESNAAAPLSMDGFTPLPLLGKELSGAGDKSAKAYVPSSFPAFPSQHTYRFTAQEDHSTRDSKKVREAAAINAQQGEEALRQLVRASKMRKQKEVKAMVQQDNQGKERFRLWESTMTRFMTNGTPAAHGKVEIADHSMIVNGDVTYLRKDVSRMGKRAPAAFSEPGTL